MNDNLDNLFKKALQEQQCEPPAHVWENIEKRLDKRHRIIPAWWLRSIAAAAVIIVSIGLWLREEDDMPITANTFVSVQPAGVEHVPVSEPAAASTPSKKTESHLAKIFNTASKRSTSASERMMPVRQQTSYANGLLAENSTPDIKNLHRDFIPLTSEDAVKNQEAYQILLNGNKEVKKEKEHVKITLSGHFTPTYSAGTYNSSVKNQRGFNYSGSQLDGMMNMGGGMQISITPRKRLSFQTGVFYSRMGQRSSDNSNAPRVAAFSTESTTPCVSTPLGNIKNSQKASVYKTAKATMLNGMSDGDETLEQVFGSIEIPLHVRYQLNNNKLLFSLSGGLSGGIIVNNKVYMKASGEKELLGSTENIRKFNLSTDLGLGVEYPLGSNIKIMVEPGFRYFLQSLSKNNLIDFKPYTFTLSTGIGIEF